MFDSDKIDWKAIHGQMAFGFESWLGCMHEGHLEILSMVFYLSNRFTNPILFDIILTNYLFSMLWHKFHEDIIMQTRIMSL